MSEKVPSSKKARAATVEDFDEERGEANPATRKTAKSHRPANSASKRTNKSPELHQEPPTPSRPIASDSVHSNHSRDSAKAKPSERTARPATEEEITSRRRPSIRKQTSRNDRPRSPEKKSTKEDRPRSPEKRSSRDKPGCDCDDCMTPRYEQRPGLVPLQQGYHALTHPYSPYVVPAHPVLHHEPYPPGYVHVPRPRAGSLMGGGRPTSFHQGMLPGYHTPGPYIPGGGYFDHPPPAQMGVEARAFDPRYQAPHVGMSPHLGQPSLGPPPRAHPSPVKPPSRPVLGRQTESYSTRTSNPHFTPKISTYNPSSKKGFDDEHISAREAPTRRRTMPGQYESSPESSPERVPPQLSRPSLKHHSTTSEVHHLQGGRDRASSEAFRYPLLERRHEFRRDYPTESLAGHFGQRSEQQYLPSRDRNSDRDPREYDKYEERRPSSRRDSIASGQTQPTSYSNPERRFMGDPRQGRSDSYIAPEPEDYYQQRENDIKAYQDARRGYPEARMNADTPRAVDGNRPRSNISHGSNRSRHSISGSQHTRTGDGGIRILVAQGSAIAFGDDMADRQIQVRSSADPGQVELLVGGSNRETRYHQSAASATHSAGPSRVSSGSTRHATRGRDESRDQVREGDGRDKRQSRAPSSRH